VLATGLGRQAGKQPETHGQNGGNQSDRASH
jgi:hypothetical protein